MIARGLWVPGRLTATNEALSLQRAAGYHQGYGKAMCTAGRWRTLRHPEDRYADAARFVRGLVGELASALHVEPAAGPVRLRFRVHGHDRWDPAAAYLVSKWCEDGLVDAGVLAGDTRREVRESSVGVCAHEWGLNPGPGIYVGWEPAP